MLSFAKKGNFDLVAGYVKKNYKNSFGILNIKKNLVKNIKEKPSTSFEINAGIYLIKNTKNLNLIPFQKYFTMPDLIQKYLSKKLKVGAYKINQYWLSIENMQNLLKLEKKINTKIK
tara:strand:- start:1142 stop:1492 length:351 start_codon:yes stop_codon:yes gene_type:complete